MLKSLKALTLAAALVGAGTGAWADAADDCEKSNDWPVKIRGCTDVIAKQPRAAWAYINRSFAYERSQQYQSALADGHKAVQLDAKHPMAYVNRAAAHIGLEDYNSAIVDTNRALKLDQGNALAFVNRAYAHEKLGHTDLAIADYRRTLELDPNKQYAKDALKRLGAP